MKVKTLIISIAFIASFVLAAQICRAQNKRGPSTAEEREQTIRLAHALETNPLDERAKAARAWLIEFLTEVPDINVKVCPSLLDPLLDSKKNYSTELVVQPLFSSAAFIIENPDKANDDEAVYLAGVEGALKAYEAILKAKPKARWAVLDEMIEKRNKGELTAYVKQLIAQKCSASKGK